MVVLQETALNSELPALNFSFMGPDNLNPEVQIFYTSIPLASFLYASSLPGNAPTNWLQKNRQRELSLKISSTRIQYGSSLVTAVLSSGSGKRLF